MIGGDKNDTLRGGDGGDGIDRLDGGYGNDRLEAGSGDHFYYQYAHGGDGVDTLLGGDGRDSSSGGSNTDLLYGGSDHDKLYGQDGVNFLQGNAGNDAMTGGTSTDHFIYDHDDFLSGNYGGNNGRDSGNDLIFDFTRGQDRLQLSFGGFDGARGVAAFDRLDTNDDGFMNKLDSFCRQGSTGLVLDIGAAAGGSSGVDMIRLDGVFALGQFDFA